MSIPELAELCNVTKSVISGYECNRYNHTKKENNLTNEDTANKLGISRGLFRFWFNGCVIKISTYNKIQDNLKKYNLV